MNTVIAEMTLFAKRPGEEPFVVTIQIGAPYKSLEDPEEWACPVSVTPLHAKLRDQHGVDSFQALGLAMALVRSVLQGFREKGGALSYDGRSDNFELKTYGL